MTPIHILWTKPLNSSSKKLETLSMMMLSALMIRKVYGRVELVTDWEGKHLVESMGIPYDYVHTGLDYVEEDKGFPTAKVHAYKLIAEWIPSFLYLDYDVFVTRKIPDKPFIIQTDEGLSMHPYAVYQYCREHGFQFPFEYEKEDLRFYNMGLFKADRDTVNEYHEAYFSTLYKNQHLHKNGIYLDQYYMFLEQNFIYMILKKKRLIKKVHQHYPMGKSLYNKYNWFDTPEELRKSKDYVGELIHRYNCREEDFNSWFDTPSSFDAITKTGYVHLAQYKMIPQVMQEMYAYAFKRFPKEFGQLINNYSKFH